MIIESLDEYLETVTGYIFDNDKIVTYKWLSKELEVHVNVAKQILWEFWRRHKEEKSFDCAFLLMGLLHDGGMRVEVVKETDLLTVKEKFTKVLSEHIYSLQKVLPDIQLLGLAENGDVKYSAIRCLENNERSDEEIHRLRWGAASSEMQSVPEEKAKPTPEPVKEPVKNEKSPEKKKAEAKKTTQKKGFNNLFGKVSNKQKSPSSSTAEKTEAKSSGHAKQTSSESSKKAGQKGGLSSFLQQGKALGKPANSVSPEAKKRTDFTAKESTSSTAKECTSSTAKESTSSAAKESTSSAAKESTSSATKESTKKKASSERNNKQKKNTRGKKRTRSKEENDIVKKRKRITIQSDSSDGGSSDGEQDEEMELEPSPETASPAKARSPSPAKVKLEGGKRKVLKKVDKTFEEDGFFVTKKVHVYESCSEDEPEVVEQPEKSVTPESRPETKVSTSVCDICSTCSCSATSKSNHVSPVANEGPIINCHGKRLGTDDMLNFDLLMLDERQASNTLILSKNNIVNLSGPLLRKLKLLRNLDLSENLMKEIHTMIFIDLNNLEDLNLSKNLLATFDDSLLEVLPALLALNLSYNQISVIEHRISKSATKINFLDLSHNNVTSLPNMFFESLSDLQYLDLSFNRIHTFDDDSLTRLNSLKTVYIRNNLLTSLRMQVFPKSLSELHCGYNSIAEVFYEPSLVKVLNIEHNRISEIHSNVTALEYLERLNVSGNAISNFPDILLESLKTLDVSHNKLPNIPETMSIKNFPLLVHLNVSKNPIQDLTLRSDLMLHTFVASNISMLESIGRDTFAKLRAPSNDCINLTVSNNRRLSSVHEEALERMNLCSLDLSNNQITYISKKVILRNASSATFNVNLQGNPFKCNCSLQWMLSDLVPQLYSTHPGLLNNLRCAWPPQILNMRMVHWYGWKEQVFCTNTSEFREELTMNVAGVSNERVTLDSSPAAIIILGAAVGVLTILIIVGFIWTQKVSMRKRRMNRKF